MTVSQPYYCAGNETCLQVNLINSTTVSCTAPSMVTGRHRVVVTLNGQSSSGSVTVDRLCGDGSFALPGRACQPCPKVGVLRASVPLQLHHFLSARTHCASSSLPRQTAHCVGMFPVPLPVTGFYPLSLTEFSACVPPAACPGVNADAVRAAYARVLSGTAPSGSDGASPLANLLAHYFSLDTAGSVSNLMHARAVSSELLL